jgi:hypothetical protein
MLLMKRFPTEGFPPMRLLVLSLAAALLLPASAQATETATADPQGRIAKAFVGLGMQDTMAACYGGKVTESLSREEAMRAASIVEQAGDGEEVREGVSHSTGNIISAFTYAKSKCGY